MIVSFSSCSGDDDDDPVSGIHDYYIECNVSGGGLDASELTELKSELNLIMTDFDLDAMDKDQAIYIFDQVVKEFKYEFSEGIVGVEGTLKITLTLKTVEGSSVKSSTLKITNTGCTVG